MNEEAIKIHLVDDHDFAVWAFGPTWLDFLVFDADGVDLARSWNTLHGELLEISPNNGVRNDMVTMKKIWSEHAR